MSPIGVTWAGVAINTVLGAGKISAGVMFHSQSILADGIHSLSDLITDFAVLLGLRVSRRPADEDHPFGHLRVSTLTALFVGAMLVIAAAWIAYEAVTTLRARNDDVDAMVPLAVALVSIASKETLYQITRIIGRRSGDPAIMANAWHHRTDAFSSIAVAVGLSAVMIGGPQWAFLDHVVALVLATFLVWVGVQTIRSASSELVDRAPDEKTLAGIREAISRTDGVRDFHAMRARQVGGKVSMDVHVMVNPDLTVKQGHDIASRVEASVRNNSERVIGVTVHIEPERRGPDY
ncbi:MAG: cation transporter [Deltaproteobacteria bacterium]|nr:cation transporter [Deltaproteobacteria bacterium]